MMENGRSVSRISSEAPPQTALLRYAVSSCLVSVKWALEIIQGRIEHSCQMGRSVQSLNKQLAKLARIPFVGIVI